MQPNREDRGTMRRAIFCLFPLSLYVEWQLMHLAWSWAVAANQRRFRNSCCWCSQELQLEEGWKTRCGGIKLKCGRAHRLSHSRWWKVIKVKDVFMYKKLLTNLFVTTCYAEQQEKQTQIQKQARKIKDEKKSAEMSNTRKDKTSRRRFRQLTDPRITSHRI